MKYENKELLGLAAEQWAAWRANEKIAKQRAYSSFKRLPGQVFAGRKNPFIARSAIIFHEAIQLVDRKIIEAFLVYHLTNESYKDKAARLGVSESTMHARLIAAHQALSNELHVAQQPNGAFRMHKCC